MTSIFFRLLAGSLAIVFVAGCSTSQRQAGQGAHDASFAASPASPKTVTILHTNDMHASFAPHDAVWMKENPKPIVGGFRELQFRVDSIRAVRQPENVLLFDAGDIMTGNPISDMRYKGAEGGALYEMMNMIGYDAGCLGNHEFDISQENARALLTVASFPILSANLLDSKNEFPVNNKDYVILERGGMRIGVFGLMLQSLATVVNPNNVTGLKVLSPEETAQKIIDKIDPQTDLIVALSHLGIEDDTVLAASVRGLDVIVGGHSHTRLAKPKVANDVLIVQAGTRAENLGVLEVTVENDRITKYNGQLLQLFASNDRPRTLLASFIDSLQAEIEKSFSEVVAELKEDWVRGRKESNIGNFIADAQREAARAHVAFVNTYGIRANVPAGPLTRRELFEVLPFRNVLVTFQLSGKQLRDIVSYTRLQDDHLQISGIRCSWRGKVDGSVDIVKMEVGGKPVDNRQTYICVANDFMVGQAKKYFGMEIPSPSFSNTTVLDAVTQVARAVKVIGTKVEGRIVEIK